MDFKIIKVVIGREYFTRVRKKSFYLTTFLVPILFALMCSIPFLILKYSTDSQKSVAVVDESGIVMSSLEESASLKFFDMCGSFTVDELKSRMDDMNMDIILHVSPLDSLKSVRASTYSEKPLSVEVKDRITSLINGAVEDYRLQSYNIEGLKQIMEDVRPDISVTTYTLEENGGEKISSSEVYMFISMILSMVIYIFIAMFGGMVMQSVIEEKSSRVVEVLVSSVKATDLMIGKIVGVALVAVTQFILWIALTALLVTGITYVTGMDSVVSNGAATEQMMNVPGMSPAVDVDVQSESGLAAVVSTLSSIDYGLMIVSFLLFFVFGYLLYASLFAAIGSAADNEADTQQLQIPVTVPLMIGFFVGLYAFRAPESQLVWWCSMIPFTSPIVMLARIPLGVATWEIVLSLSLLVATFFGCAWLSAKIYKVGILMFGKKSTFKDLWTWLKMK